MRSDAVRNFLEVEEAVKLKALIGDREEELVLKVADGRVAAEIGGRVYDSRFARPQPDSYLFFLNTDVHECRVRPSARKNISMSAFAGAIMQ